MGTEVSSPLGMLCWTLGAADDLFWASRWGRMCLALGDDFLVLVPKPAWCLGASGCWCSSPLTVGAFSPCHSCVPLGPPAALEGGHSRPARRGQHQARRSRPHHQHLQLYLVFGRQGLASHFPSPSAQWTEHHAHAEKGQVEPGLALCGFTPGEVEGAGIHYLWGWQQGWEASAHLISVFLH